VLCHFVCCCDHARLGKLACNILTVLCSVLHGCYPTEYPDTSSKPFTHAAVQVAAPTTATAALQDCLWNNVPPSQAAMTEHSMGAGARSAGGRQPLANRLLQHGENTRPSSLDAGAAAAAAATCATKMKWPSGG
jgi:hypothetical protein